MLYWFHKGFIGGRSMLGPLGVDSASKITEHAKKILTVLGCLFSLSVVFVVYGFFYKGLSIIHSCALSMEW